MYNVPKMKVGIVAVSRDCFPIELSENRRKEVCKHYNSLYSSKDLYECPFSIFESETDMLKCLDDVKKNECNALVVYLGNFGPEISETLLAKNFDGPIMFCAAEEEDISVLSGDRGDAYCGLLNASYNLKLRNIKAYIPEHPVGTPEEVAKMIHEFVPVARSLHAIKNLKIISFGPRPNNFLACNAPIKQLYNIGIEIEENSELDLFDSYKNHEGDKRIPDVVEDMKKELGLGIKVPQVLPKLAQYELTLLDWVESHKGCKKYVCVAAKCWPAFQPSFGFVPCYVNSRLTGRGIPVSCEVDIYGALSEYIGQCVTEDIVTLLDINNTLSKDLYKKEIENKFDYQFSDTFMGFHCGNTCSKLLCNPILTYQRIMARGVPQELTNGTIEGDIKPGNITFFRLQSTADNHLYSYVAEGEVLPVPTHSFGSIGVFAIKEMARFYRYVLIENGFPHHGAVAFGHNGKAIFEVFRYLGVEKIDYNHEKYYPYDNENPYK